TGCEFLLHWTDIRRTMTRKNKRVGLTQNSVKSVFTNLSPNSARSSASTPLPKLASRGCSGISRCGESASRPLSVIGYLKRYKAHIVTAALMKSVSHSQGDHKTTDFTRSNTRLSELGPAPRGHMAKNNKTKIASPETIVGQ